MIYCFGFWLCLGGFDTAHAAARYINFRLHSVRCFMILSSFYVLLQLLVSELMIELQLSFVVLMLISTLIFAIMRKT